MFTKHFYYFLVNSGKIIFISFSLLVIAICLYSFTIKGKVNYGNRCYVNFNKEIITNYVYRDTILKREELKCNTYYLEYDTTLNEEEIKVFLVSLAKLEKDNEVVSNLHIVVTNGTYEFLATIVEYKVSYLKSLI